MPRSPRYEQGTLRSNNLCARGARRVRGFDQAAWANPDTKSSRWIFPLDVWSRQQARARCSNEKKLFGSFLVRGGECCGDVSVRHCCGDEDVSLERGALRALFFREIARLRPRHTFGRNVMHFGLVGLAVAAPAETKTGPPAFLRAFLV